MCDRAFIFPEVPHDPFLQRCSVFPSSYVELKVTDTNGWGHSSWVEHLSSLSRALSLSPSMKKKLVNLEHLSQTWLKGRARGLKPEQQVPWEGMSNLQMQTSGLAISLYLDRREKCSKYLHTSYHEIQVKSVFILYLVIIKLIFCPSIFPKGRGAFLKYWKVYFNSSKDRRLSHWRPWISVTETKFIRMFGENCVCSLQVANSDFHKRLGSFTSSVKMSPPGPRSNEPANTKHCVDSQLGAQMKPFVLLGRWVCRNNK